MGYDYEEDKRLTKIALASARGWAEASTTLLLGDGTPSEEVQRALMRLTTAAVAYADSGGMWPAEQEHGDDYYETINEELEAAADAWVRALRGQPASRDEPWKFHGEF